MGRPWSGELTSEDEVAPNSRPAPDGAGAPPPVSKPPRRTTARGLVRAIASIGSFALVFTTYSVVLDHVPANWFFADWLRYVFAFFVAVSVGLGLRQLLSLRPVRQALGEPDPATALLPGVRPGPGGGLHGSSADEIFDGARRKVVSDYRSQPRGAVAAVGWSQYFGVDEPPSAIGSSYGLRLVMALDIREPRIDRRAVIDSVLSQRRPNGGWAASTQRDIGRPEVTAWVLGALAPAGLPGDDRERIIADLEKMIDKAADPVGMKRLTVLTTVASTLAAVAPGSTRLPELAELLRAAASVTRESGREYAVWGELTDTAKEKPSVPHTARAVLTLHRVAVVLPHRAGALQPLVTAGVAWLSKDAGRRLRSEQEEIRRPHHSDIDGLFVGHFTAAWVARAFMTQRNLDRPEQLTRAIQDIVRHQKQGVWEWDNRQEPTWMTYQGVAALKEYALRRQVFAL